MAKSTRSKVKRSFRAKKREEGVYAATEAARLNRLHAKLNSVVRADVLLTNEEGMEEDEVLDDDLLAEEAKGMVPQNDSMQVDSSQKISTHGPRGSRREEWRLSKGMTARPTPKGMNREGGTAARRKAGRSKRRR